MNFIEAVEEMEKGNDVFVNGKELFSGTSKEFFKAEFTLKKHFCLSDKIQIIDYEGLGCEDVKEFIKRFKDWLCENQEKELTPLMIVGEIDRLAGDKLK